jgi:cell division protease FtsH
MADFEEAQDKVLLGKARSLLLDRRERRVIAYHEAGHAIVAWFTPAADPVGKVTIVPHGQALGVTEQLPGEDRYSYSHSYLMARLAVMLGGRTAEEIACGDVTTGAENDLVEATRLARRMVTRWGMGKLSLLAFKADEQLPFLGYELAQGRDYSEATAALIDQEMQHLLEERHEAVHRLLSSARALLDHLAQTLLQEETLDQEALVHMLGPRPALIEAPADSAVDNNVSNDSQHVADRPPAHRAQDTAATTICTASSRALRCATARISRRHAELGSFCTSPARSVHHWPHGS